MYKRYEKYKDSGIEWIGEVPDRWSISKLKNYVYCLDSKRVPLSSEVRSEMQGNYPYWGANCIIDFVDGWLFDGETVLLGEDGAPFFDWLKPVAFYSNTKIWANNHVHVLKPKGRINAEFISFFLNIVDYKDYIKGSTRDKLTQSEMNKIPILSAPKSEQDAITCYLNHKTSVIDSLIADKEKLIQKLQEYKQSIIAEAVTKGLNSGLKMKDSGVEWIGEVPEHWEINKLIRIAYIKGRIGWQGLRAEEFTNEGPYLITGMHFDNGTINWDSCYRISEKRYQQAPEIKVREGDLLITKDGTIGKVAFIDMLPGKASLNSHLLLIRPKNNGFNTRYLFWLFQSNCFIHYVNLNQVGTTFNAITQSKVEKFKLSLPPFQEQISIARYLDKMDAEICYIIEIVLSQIQNLKEYRQSLIYEAVTGKIDVRDYQPERSEQLA